MNKLKLFSFFSGSGFLDLGFEYSGFDIELVNEFSESFMNAYKYSRETLKLKKPTFGYANIDINEYLGKRREELSNSILEARKDGSLIGFIGGPPCPDFSVGGKQKGKHGDNGRLTQSYIDLIIEQRPDFFLFENVKGLWKTKKHREFYEEVKTDLKNADYLLTERLTNALEFATPQDRDRILLFGINSSLSNRFGNPEDAFPWDKYIKYNLDDLKNIPWPTTDTFVVDGYRACPDGIPKELTVQYWFDKNDVLVHPNAKDCFTPKAGLAKMKIIDEGDDSKKSYKRIHRWRYSPTAAYGNNEVHLHPYKERRLTVAEALSIQSLPKEFSLPPEMSLTDKFKTTGNGVPFLMALGIANTIRDYLNGGEIDGKSDSI